MYTDVDHTYNVQSLQHTRASNNLYEYLVVSARLSNKLLKCSMKSHTLQPTGEHGQVLEHRNV